MGEQEPLPEYQNPENKKLSQLPETIPEPGCSYSQGILETCRRSKMARPFATAALILAGSISVAEMIPNIEAKAADRRPSRMSPDEFMQRAKDKLFPDKNIDPQGLNLTAHTAIMKGYCGSDLEALRQITDTPASTLEENCDGSTTTTSKAFADPIRYQANLNELGSLVAWAHGQDSFSQTTSKIEGIPNTITANYECPGGKENLNSKLVIFIDKIGTKLETSSGRCPIPQEYDPVLSVGKRPAKYNVKKGIIKFAVLVKGRNIDDLRASVIATNPSRLKIMRKSSPQWSKDRTEKGYPSWKSPTFALGSLSSQEERKRLTYRMKVPMNTKLRKRVCSTWSFRTYSSITNMVTRQYKEVCNKVIRYPKQIPR